MSKYLRFGVSLVLLGVLAWRTDWAHVAEAFIGLKWGYWVSAFVLLASTQVVSAYRWRLVARTFGLDGTIVQLTAFYFIGMFFNLFLPTSVGGDVVRACYISSGTGRRLAGFLSVFIDRANGLLVLLGVASIAAALQFQHLPAWVILFVWGTTACGLIGMALLPWLARFGKQTSLRVQQVRTLLQLMNEPRLLLQITLLSVVVQVANVIIVWQLGLGLSLEANVDFSYYWVLVPMVTVLTLLPSVNGMGVREWGMFLMLEPLGVSEAAAVTLSFLWLLVAVFGGMFGGLAYLSGRFTQTPLLAKDGPHHGSVDRHSDQGRAGQLDAAA